ncbi:3'-5' exonuclease [Methylobacterium sp. D54C]
MAHDSLLCIDIETCPDRDVMPAEWGSKFPKPAWHRVVAISFVEAAIERVGDRESYRVECCRTGGEADWDEARLLGSFWRRFGKRMPRVVSWNGRGFDMPVLRLRAMLHGIPADGWYGGGTRYENYTQRFAADWHCDLMEMLSDHGACSRMGLDDVAKAMGLPGKIGGHGSEVADMVARGEIDRVRAYCEGDVANLFGLYVRWAFLAGKVDASGHNASIESLVDCLERDRMDRPHLGEFLDAWRASQRPAPMLVPVPGFAKRSGQEPGG